MRAEVDEIVSAASDNAEHDISGALLATGNVFSQILEGPPDSVEAVFSKIRADVRHTDVCFSRGSFAAKAGSLAAA